MKKLIAVLSIILLFFSFTSCGSSSSGSSGSVVGKWQDTQSTVQFNKDGTFSDNYYWLTGKYTIKEKNTITISASLLPNEDYQYKVENDTLTLSQNNKAVYVFKKVK